MIGGNPQEFIDGLYYGEERFFLFNGKKYFIQGYISDGKPLLEVYIIESSNDNFEWHAKSINNHYPVSQFEDAKIFNGETFWKVEQEITWIDC